MNLVVEPLGEIFREITDSLAFPTLITLCSDSHINEMSSGIGKKLSTAAAAAVQSSGNLYTVPGSAASFMKNVKVGHAPWSHTLPSFEPKQAESSVRKSQVDPRHWEPLGGWSADEVKDSVKDNVLLTW